LFFLYPATSINMHFLTALSVAALSWQAAASPAVGLEKRQATQRITINPAKTYQEIDGFGFSAAFQRANLIINLPAAKQKQVLDLLFNTQNGTGFSILRNGIGSTPNSNSDYMNTILPRSPGSPSGTPQYVWDRKDSGQLWLSQQAVSYGVSTV
jgi:O-glycosyl hydrolase